MADIDGKSLALQMQEQLAQEIQSAVAAGKRPPHLVAVLVGEAPASRTYVRNKMLACKRVGMTSQILALPNETAEEELLEHIRALNADASVDGFIVQLPLPSHIDSDKVLLHIAPEKDVDGFHPLNIGRMTLGLPSYVPATPWGITQMLLHYSIPIEGKQCVILGRSNIVGRPLSILLSQNAPYGNATVTVLHSRSRNVERHCREADILVAAIGKPHFVHADMVKEGAVVIDVGINKIPDPDASKGYRIVGDVDYAAVKDKCSWITPVPGGVGPMTVTGLLYNTWKAYRREVYHSTPVGV